MRPGETKHNHNLRLGINKAIATICYEHEASGLELVFVFLFRVFIFKLLTNCVTRT